jgi:hypothetical protein
MKKLKTIIGLSRSTAQITRSAVYWAFYSTFRVRLPQINEIIEATIPYLNAIIYEVIPLSPTNTLSVREATVDTTILGHMVPKGTIIFMVVDDPSISRVGGRCRSVRDFKHQVGIWKNEDIHLFKTERWLKGDP